MDAITLLRQDHKTVEKLFKQYEKTGDGATKKRREIVDQIIEELSKHAAIEEQVFYPAVREEVEREEDDVLEALEEHHIVKWTLDELQSMPADSERFNAKVTVLIESVRHHVKEEEDEMFPEVRKGLGRKRLNEIGDQMASLKPIAPTRPHPRAPDEPPANLLVNTGAGAVDLVRDTGKKALKKAKNVATGGDGQGEEPAKAKKSPSKATKAASKSAGKAEKTAKVTGKKAKSGGKASKAGKATKAKAKDAKSKKASAKS